MLVGLSGAAGSKQTQSDAWLYIDELTHRTMNNFALMLAILERASRTSIDPTAGRAFDEVKARLRAAANAHRALQPPGRDDTSRLDTTLGTLCVALSESMLAEQSISLTLFCEPVVMSARRCWQAGLIVSELVTNAARHAFSNAAEGAIVVEVRTFENTMWCAVFDNGSADEGAAPGRGSVIVSALAAELGGTIARRHTHAGSAVVLTAPIQMDIERGGDIAAKQF